ncbi:AEC family transporter [Pseudidiomarina sediminum]|uniref:AEC family transporter n=1 Tax=Pseudidiomarina sediminum TaxID=431675 RepID=A0A432Z116_9GAMM|nr:AEC family transporter [Pseudidiomarina sediminum]RUO69849.1 AEC family transporter [Pseudidiomarina sediminum]
MANFLYIAGYVFIGLLLRRSPQFPQNTGQILNAYVIYVALPALVFQKIPYLTFGKELLYPALMPWILLLLTVPAVLAIARWRGWSRSTTGAMLIVIPLGNTSFIGFPMIEAFFGPEGIPYALLYDQLGSFFILSIYATIIAAVYSHDPGEDSHRPSAKTIAWKIIKFPPFVALLAAFAVRGVEYPEVAQHFIDSLAVTLVPVIMVAVGFQLRFRLPQEDRGPLVWALGLKLVATPLVALALLIGFGLDDLAVQVTIMEAAMPAMISAGALAIMAGLAPTLSAAVVGYGVLACFATLPLWYFILQYLQQLI